MYIEAVASDISVIFWDTVYITVRVSCFTILCDCINRLFSMCDGKHH